MSGSGPDLSLTEFPAALEFVHVCEVKLNVPRDPVEYAPEEQHRMPSGWELSYECADAGEGRYIATLGAKAVFGEPAGKQISLFEGESGDMADAGDPYEFSLAIRGGVSVSDHMDDGFVDEWLENGLRFLLFPYLRSAITNAMSGTGWQRAYFPLFSVPVFTRPGRPQDIEPE